MSSMCLQMFYEEHILFINSVFATLMMTYKMADEICRNRYCCKWHDDVIKRKHFSRCWPFVRGIHRFPVNSPHKSQWCRALMFFICARINGLVKIVRLVILDAISPIIASLWWSQIKIILLEIDHLQSPYSLHLSEIGTYSSTHSLGWPAGMEWGTVTL